MELSHCRDALRWLRRRGWSLAPLTGQDHAVLIAILHCWQLWTRSDETGRRAAVDAVAALLDGCQEVVWPMARELIAHVGDWHHRDVVWPKVVERFMARQPRGGLGRVEEERTARLARCYEGLKQVEPRGA
jgi:hypothetical protein